MSRSMLKLAAAAAAVCVAAGGAWLLRAVSDLRARAALYEARWRKLRRDPGDLARYRTDDARLREAGRVPGRVVFLGASITEAMDLSRRFPGEPFVNRGVSGQLVWQEYLRLPEDVWALEPDAVVLKVCATNFERDAPPLEETQGYVTRMAEQSRARGIRPVLATVVPVSRGYAAAQAPWPVASRIDAMNRWLRDYARAHGDRVIDYAAALSDAEGFLPDALTDDGLHPNDRGYDRMAAAVRAEFPAAAARRAARAEAAQ